MKHYFLLCLTAGALLFSSCKKDALDTEPELEVPENPNPPTPPPPPPPPVNHAENESLHLGNPSNAAVDVNMPTNYLLDEGYYALSYHRDRAIPNWVSWHVQSSDIGTAPRQDDFRGNLRLPVGWYRVETNSYTGSGFDRGHMCPSSDRTLTIQANSSTFLMTNMIPQAPTNNQVVWANLESYCRTLVDQGNELYIIAGTAGSGGTGNNGFATTIDNGRITVPAYVWKTILVLPAGTDDKNRIESRTRVISVLIPNDNAVSNNWRTFRVSADELETLTGYDFFSAVPQSIQDVIEAVVDTL